MIERLKNIAMTVVGVVVVFAIPFLFVRGALWASEHLLQPLIVLGWLVFFVDLLVLLPLSLVRRLRPYTGGLIYMSSWLFGLVTWLFGFVITYSLWGGFAVIIGLVFFGVGVVFTGVIASLTHGMWELLVALVMFAVVTFAARTVGILIGNQPVPSEEVIGP